MEQAASVYPNYEGIGDIIHGFLPFLDFVPPWIYSLIVIVIAAVAAVSFILLFEGVGSLVLRKLAGDIQSRIGPNRVGIYGCIQFLADGVKLILKEDLKPADCDRILFRLAPYLVFVGSCAGLVVIPFAVGMIVADLDIGIFYVMAVASLVSVGLLLGGWASNNKYSLIGAMRGAAQMVSFEIPVVMSLMPVVLIAGTLSLQGIVHSQGGLFGIFGWNLFHNPFTFLSFFVYMIAGQAEAAQTPFDLPECESELVQGFTTEYSGIRFGYFFLGEFGEVFIVCALATAGFLGGWHLPGPFGAADLGWFWGNLLSLTVFLIKSFTLVLISMWIRWTMPRIRVDQLMRMCWKYLVPITFFNLFGVSLWLLLLDGKGIPALIAALFG